MATKDMTVNNTSNAPHIPGKSALPFTTQRHMQIMAKIKAQPDALNTGSDYPDEGLPFMESDPNLTKRSMGPRPAFGHVPGLIDTPTASEQHALSHMDESAQGTHIHYVESAIVVDVDAKLILSNPTEMRSGKFREAHYPSLKEYRNSPYYRQLRESQAVLHNVAKIAEKTYFSKDKKGVILNPLQTAGFKRIDNQILKSLKESFGKKPSVGGKRLREGLGGDDFSLDWGGGRSGSSMSSGFDMPGNGRDTDYIPLISGPYNKQLYWFDYLDMHSRAFEAWTHNPIAKRIVKLICQFVLGKGVKATVITAEMDTGKTEYDQETGQEYQLFADLREEAQGILDDHWARNRMALRAKEILRDLIVFGEQFVRYFDVADGLKVRSLDPSTIWEVVTDPDDCESEFYIHQQYPTRYQWYVDLPVPTIKYIIRQVPSKLYYHMKINNTSGEVRGRSELFAILGWLKRLKEFATDRVIRNKMANLFVLDVAVEGSDAEVQMARTQFAVIPTPGSFFIHNKAAELQGVKAEIGAGDVTPDCDLLMTVIAMGAGVSKEYLGMSDGGGGKAGALVGTEPDVKTFEDYQELLEQFLLYDAKCAFDRAKELKKIVPGVSIKVEITYPALAEENRSEKLKDIAFMESMSWISHRRGATMGAKEMQITTYEFDEEQHAIAKEDAEADILFNSAMAQVQKGQSSTPPPDSGGASGGGGAKPPSGGGGGAPTGKSSPAAGTTPASNEAESMEPVFGTHLESGDKDKGWKDRDPRTFHESLLREAANIRLKKKPINRRRNRILTPDKRRDQSTLDRGDVVTKARKALHGNYNEAGRRPGHVSDSARQLGNRKKESLGLDPPSDDLQDPPVSVPTVGHPPAKLHKRRVPK